MKMYQMSALAIALSTASLGHAGQKHDHDHDNDHEVRQHGTHVHGAASLTLALEGDRLELEFSSPAMNLVGFEHAAANADQKKKVEAAVNALRQVATLLAVDANAGCSLQEAEVKTSLLESTGADAHQHEEKDAHHQDADAKGASNHSEFEVHYHLTCSSPDSLKTFKVNLFGQYSGVESISAQWVTPTSQGAKEVTAKDASFSIR